MYSNRSANKDGPSADLHAYQQSYKTVTHKSQDIQIYDAYMRYEGAAERLLVAPIIQYPEIQFTKQTVPYKLRG